MVESNTITFPDYVNPKVLEDRLTETNGIGTMEKKYLARDDVLYKQEVAIL